MNETPEQLNAAGSAARNLLRFAWARQPRIGLLAITGIMAVAKTFSTDVAASATLLRRLIEREHLSQYGHEELPWLTRQIEKIVNHNPSFAVEIYQATYAYEEGSDTKTSIGSSALLPLSSNRRQDYEGAWYALTEAMPAFLRHDLETACRAVVRSAEGYVQRSHPTPYPGEPERAPFSVGKITAHLSSDGSHSWYRGGYRSPKDVPALLVKFDAYLEEISQKNGGDKDIEHILNVLAAENELAVLWASLLVAGTNHPAQFAGVLAPLACAEPVMMSSDTRHQLGNFIRGAYTFLSRAQRVAIETSILALGGERQERFKAILAGCIPEELVALPEMARFLEELDNTGGSRPNAPPFQITSSFRTFDTDAYLESEGVSLDDPITAALRELMRGVEELPKGADAGKITLKDAQAQLQAIEALSRGLTGRSKSKLPVPLSDHASGLLAEAAARLARARPTVTGCKTIRPTLERVLLFCAKSPNPHLNVEQEDSFHENLSWGGPSARTSAAVGLLDLVRGDKQADRKLMAAIRKLSRDPVAHVRLQIIQNLGMMRNLDARWMWSEVEHATLTDASRGVVAGALSALSHISHLDLPRSIGIAKGVLQRYRATNEPGMAHCRGLATTLIFDLHIVESSTEADQFAFDLMNDIVSNSELIRHLIARYSDKLLVGSVSHPDAPDHEHRRTTLAFYSNAVSGAFALIDKYSKEYDIRKFATWPGEAQEAVRSMFGILDEVSLRCYFASGAYHNGSAPALEMSPERARFYRESLPLYERLSGAIVAPVAHHLIQALEAFISLDPPGVFALIAQSVRSSESGGYALESMAADLVVRIVERYLADHRSIFANPDRLKDLMDCLDVFVRAGWPSAQSLVFKLGEIWR